MWPRTPRPGLRAIARDGSCYGFWIGTRPYAALRVAGADEASATTQAY